MNKTIIININGSVFHIEEDAYEILKNYMTDVKRHFMNSADSFEITTDIENRIAEMFGEILQKDSKQVITELDVNMVIEQMGTIADFEHDEEEGKPSSAQSSFSMTTPRRLFRDPDDHLVAGVCSGIANYFEINVVWIRLLFAFSFVAAGSGLFLYIILWIVVPKAVTRADRMAMKGEKQNLQGFKKNLENELNFARQNISNFSGEAKPLVHKARDFAADFFQHLGLFLKGAAKVFFKLIGVVFLIICFCLVISFVIAFVAAVGFGDFHFIHGTPLSLIHNRNITPVLVSALLVAIIPLLSIILIILKVVFNTSSVNYITGTTALIVWIAAVGSLVFYATKIAANFRESAGFTETINLRSTKNNAYYLKLNNLKYFSADDSVRLNIKTMFHRNTRITDEDENRELYNVDISVEKSDVNKPVLIESYRARGRDFDNALFNARNTRYIFNQKDSVLTFDYKLMNTHENEWHGEEIYLTLKLPLNARVVIDQDLTRILNANVWDCNEINKRDNDKVKSATFIMTDNGLQCKIDTVVTLKTDSISKKINPDSSSNKN